MRHELKRSIESRKALRQQIRESIANARRRRALTERRVVERKSHPMTESILRRRRLAESFAKARARRSVLSRALTENRTRRPFGRKALNEEELDMELVDDEGDEDLDMELLLGESAKKPGVDVKQLNENKRFQRLIGKYLNEGKEEDEEDEDEKKVIDEDDEELGDVKGKAKRKALRHLRKPGRRLREGRTARRRICK